MGMHTPTTSALLLAVLGSACGSHSVLVPPRLDLRPYAKLGLVTFTVENAKGSLHQYATERFAEEVLAAQPGIEVLELGSVDTLLQRVGEQELGIAGAQALGRARDVGAVFAGHLKVTNPKASGGITGLMTQHLEATVRVDLTVRLLSTQSGGTLWRSSAIAPHNLVTCSPRRRPRRWLLATRTCRRGHRRKPARTPSGLHPANRFHGADVDTAPANRVKTVPAIPPRFRRDRRVTRAL